LSVKINLPSSLRHLTNDQAVVEVNGNTVGQCLEQLIARFPRTRKRLLEKNGALSRIINIYINGESASPEGLKTAVKDGDELHIEVIISGG